MHELTDDIRHFIYQEKDELGYDLYLSIRMKMAHKYKKGEIDRKTTITRSSNPDYIKKRISETKSF
jgi:hypothetical protein